MYNIKPKKKIAYSVFLLFLLSRSQGVDVKKIHKTFMCHLSYNGFNLTYLKQSLTLMSIKSWYLMLWMFQLKQTVISTMVVFRTYTGKKPALHALYHIQTSPLFLTAERLIFFRTSSLLCWIWWCYISCIGDAGMLGLTGRVGFTITSPGDHLWQKLL